MSDQLNVNDIGLKETGVLSSVFTIPAFTAKAGLYQGNTTVQYVCISGANEVESGIFSGCQSLQRVIVPGIESYDGIDLFGADRALVQNVNSIVIQDGTRYIGNTFADLPGLQSIRLPTGLIRFDADSLSGDSGLLDLDIGIGTDVGISAFAFMPSLVSIKAPLTFEVSTYGFAQLQNLNEIHVKSATGGVTVNGTVFGGCGASKIAFQDSGAGVNGIEASAFNNCYNLMSVDLNASVVKTLPVSAFANCGVLNSVYLNESVLGKGIMRDAFAGCRSVELYGASDTEELHYTGSEKLIFKNGIKGDAMRSVYAEAFSNIDVPGMSVSFNNLTYIQQSAFMNCTLSSVYVNTDGGIPTACFMGSSALERVSVGQNITGIGISALQDCQKLTDITFGGTGVDVGDMAFYGDRELSGIDFANVKRIGARSFAGCAKLTQAELNFGALQSIGDYAFQQAINGRQASIELPPAIMTESKNIGDKIFMDCSLQVIQSDITMAEFDALSTSIGRSLIPADFNPGSIIPIYADIKAFFGTASDFELRLKDIVYNSTGTGNTYKCLKVNDDGTQLIAVDTSKPDISQFYNSPIIPSKITAVCNAAFVQEGVKDNLRRIDLNNVISVGDNAFNGCDQLADVSGRSVISVGNGAFCGNISLASFILNKVEKLGDRAFYGCSRIETGDFSGLKTAGSEAFRGCTQLTEFTAPLLGYIGSKAFEGCARLTDITLPAAVEVSDYAFSNCTKLTFAQFGSTLTSIGNRIVSGCSKLAELKANCDFTYATYALAGCPKSLNVIYGISMSGITKMNGIYGAETGVKAYSIDNGYRYPIRIVTPNGLYKSPHAAFNVKLGDSGILLQSIDNSFLPDSGRFELSSNYFNGLASVLGGCVETCDRIPTIYVTASQIDGGLFCSGAFRRCKSLQQIIVEGSYSHNIDPYLSLIDRNADRQIRITFTNSGGIIRYNPLIGSWEYTEGTEVFRIMVDSSGKKIIIGVNDNNASEYQDITNEANEIGAQAFMGSSKIKRLNIREGSLTAINDYAFFENYSISSVEMASGIKQIGDRAFEKSSVRKINIPNSMNPAGGYGLNRGYCLQDLSYDSGITGIVPSSMIDCASILSGLTLPVTLKRVGDHAFAQMYRFLPYIDRLNIDQLTALASVEDFAFYNTLRNTSDDRVLRLPKSLTDIGAAAFAYGDDAWTQEISGLQCDYANSAYDGLVMDGVKTIGASAFMRNCFKEIRFGQDLTGIGEFAFAFPKQQYSVCVPNSTKSIGKGAMFHNVIVNPDRVDKNIISVDVDKTDDILDMCHTKINDRYEAQNTISVTDYSCLIAIRNKTRANYVFAMDRKLHVCPDGLDIDILTRTLLSARHDLTSVYVPNYVTCIGPSAFMGCDQLVSVSAYAQNLSICTSAFYGCEKLEELNGPAHYEISVINPYQFYNCKKLKNIRLSWDALSVGRYGLYNCESLANYYDFQLSVRDYYCLTSIGDSSFAGCKSFTSCFIPGALSVIGYQPYARCGASLTVINVNMESEQFRDIVNPLSSVGQVVRDKFYSIRNDGLCRINFTDAVYMNDGNVKIDDEYVKIRQYEGISAVSALEYDKLIEDDQYYLNLSNISEVDPFVFRNVELLEIINFLPGRQYLSSVGAYSFSGCSKLRYINKNDLSCAYIGEYAFSDCGSISALRLDQETLHTIKQGAFYKTSLDMLYVTIDVSDPAQGMPAGKLAEFKQKIGYDETLNPNPLELPSKCQISFYSREGVRVGLYDYMLHDLIGVDIDINRNEVTFVDKRRDAIRPLVLVQSSGKNNLPVIVRNEFHANLIGRWK